MIFYECITLQRPDLSTVQVNEFKDYIFNFMAEHNGEVKKDEYWGLRELAYPVKKNKKAHYALFNFECDSATIIELERRLKLKEDVLRHLIVKIDRIDPQASPIIRTENEEQTH